MSDLAYKTERLHFTSLAALDYANLGDKDWFVDRNKWNNIRQGGTAIRQSEARGVLVFCKPAKSAHQDMCYVLREGIQCGTLKEAPGMLVGMRDNFLTTKGLLKLKEKGLLLTVDCEFLGDECMTEICASPTKLADKKMRNLPIVQSACRYLVAIADGNPVAQADLMALSKEEGGWLGDVIQPSFARNPLVVLNQETKEELLKTLKKSISPASCMYFVELEDWNHYHSQLKERIPQEYRHMPTTHTRAKNVLAEFSVGRHTDLIGLELKNIRLEKVMLPRTARELDLL